MHITYTLGPRGTMRPHVRKPGKGARQVQRPANHKHKKSVANPTHMHHNGEGAAIEAAKQKKINPAVYFHKPKE